MRSTPHRVINRSSERCRVSLAFFYEPTLEMEMPDGITLTRNGKDPVTSYGDHIYRSYAGSYPDSDVEKK